MKFVCNLIAQSITTINIFMTTSNDPINLSGVGKYIESLFRKKHIKLSILTKEARFEWSQKRDKMVVFAQEYAKLAFKSRSASMLLYEAFHQDLLNHSRHWIKSTHLNGMSFWTKVYKIDSVFGLSKLELGDFCSQMKMYFFMKGHSELKDPEK